MGRGIPRTPDDVTEHSQLTMQRFLEVLSSPDKQLVTSVMSGSQHTVHLLINNILIYAASNLFRSKLINIYYNQIIHGLHINSLDGGAKVKSIWHIRRGRECKIPSIKHHTPRNIQALKHATLPVRGQQLLILYQGIFET